MNQGWVRTLLEESLAQIAQTLSGTSRQSRELLHDRTNWRRHLCDLILIKKGNILVLGIGSWIRTSKVIEVEWRVVGRRVTCHTSLDLLYSPNHLTAECGVNKWREGDIRVIPVQWQCSVSLSARPQGLIRGVLSTLTSSTKVSCA